jgi:hypothetical protein
MEYYDVDVYAREVTTASPEAQLWFNRGLVWCFAYFHDEAAACFRNALTADPSCAMAFWGVAYATGPNYNLPWELRDENMRRDSLAAAYDATQAALALAEAATPAERALIEALPARFPQREPHGRVPAWLGQRMTRLGVVITQAIVHHYGRDEFLRRLAHPFWFQSFGAVMGMDWHSSGITTSVIGALKRGLEPLADELGLHVCGGRGEHSRRHWRFTSEKTSRTPASLLESGTSIALSADRHSGTRTARD